jgi:Asp-tRNA(Asn)/Glu-tRNA(Gln) amidotransferase A subunit family amidase
MFTISAAAEAIRLGRLSPVELLQSCLQQIDRYEPQVKAWVFVDRDGARDAAQRAEKEIRSGQWRGPLHGIPIGIKDIFDVFDWPTAGGSKLWANSIARRDCTVVERLRRAGAVFVGKTVTTAFASFDPPPTRNPWDRSRTPGGSSSGSAAALACGMCLGALGSQTGGSITRPASYCGVAGCKPTFGRVSTDGVMPLAPSMDHPGPMGRSVRDLAVLLQVMAGADIRDASCSERPVPDYPAVLDRPFNHPRLGRLRGIFEQRAEPAVKTLMLKASDTLASAGALLTDVALPAGFAEVVARHRTIMAVEAAMYHELRLQSHANDYPPKIAGLLAEGLACPAPEYARCKEYQRQLSWEMTRCFAECDALLCPATTSAAPPADSTGDPAFNSPWSLTGLPTVSIPAGKSSEGLPLAIQLVGPAWSEAELLRVAAWCEKTLCLELGEPPI